MNKLILYVILTILLITNQSMSEENIMILKLKNGNVKIELFLDVAPNHVKRIKDLADDGTYDNVVFFPETSDVKTVDAATLKLINHIVTSQLL